MGLVKRGLTAAFKPSPRVGDLIFLGPLALERTHESLARVRLAGRAAFVVSPVLHTASVVCSKREMLMQLQVHCRNDRATCAIKALKYLLFGADYADKRKDYPVVENRWLEVAVGRFINNGLG